MKNIIIKLSASFLTCAFASAMFAVTPTEMGPFNKSIGAVPYAKDHNGTFSVVFGRYKLNDIFYYGPLIDEAFAGNASPWKWDNDTQIKAVLKNIEISPAKVKMSDYIKTNLEGPFVGTGRNGHELKLFVWDMSLNPGSFNLWQVATFPKNDASWGFTIDDLKLAQEVGGGDAYTTITLPAHPGVRAGNEEYRILKAFWDAFKKTPLMQGAHITSGAAAPSQTAGGAAAQPGGITPQPSQPTAPTTGQVKAIDQSKQFVVGLLPYYFDQNKQIHILVGKYQDAALNEEITSAPVEVTSTDVVLGVTKAKSDANNKYFKAPSYMFNFEVPTAPYSIGTQNFKNYYLFTFEITQADAKKLETSLLQQPGNVPAPQQIVDVNLYDYIPGKLMGANVKAQPAQPLYVDFMKSGKVEMRAARGFAESLQEAIAQKSTYFTEPADPVAANLTAFADALNKLAPKI